MTPEVVKIYEMGKRSNWTDFDTVYDAWILSNNEPTTTHKNNETNDKFYRKVAFLMYTEMVNFTPQS